MLEALGVNLDAEVGTTAEKQRQEDPGEAEASPEKADEHKQSNIDSSVLNQVQQMLQKKLNKSARRGSVESTGSSAEKRRLGRQPAPSAHDYLYVADPYLMKLAVQDTTSEKQVQVDYIEDKIPKIEVEEKDSTPRGPNALDEAPVSLSKISRLENELNSLQNMQDLFKKLDDRIDKRKELCRLDEESPKEITAPFIKLRAQQLFKAVKGLDTMPCTEEAAAECDRFVLNVFKLFSEDPLQNTAVVCAIKNQLLAVDGFAELDRTAMSKKKKEKVQCSHAFVDDVELQSRYRLQLWFLNFCKYLYMLIYTFEVRREELKDAEEDEVVDGEAVESKQQKIKDLQQLPGGPIKLRKVSKTRLACKNILKCLAKQAESFTMEERAVLKDHMSAKTLLESPLIKIIEEEMQEQILEYKVHHAAH